MHRLSDNEGKQLLAIMLATRPDWANRNPSHMLHAANEHGFTQAADYPHMVRALAVYATLPDANGQPFGRGPDGYTRAGQHWTTTAPPDFTVPRGPECKVHRHSYQPCPWCRSDRIAEQPQAAPTRAASSIPKETK
jgi:hypothetical protein